MLVGVYFRNGSGRLSDLAVRSFRLRDGLEGCQSGLGIFAHSAGGGTARVEVEDSSVHAFQKNGITGNEAVGSTPEEFETRFKADLAKFAKIVKEAHISPQD